MNEFLFALLLFACFLFTAMPYDDQDSVLPGEVSQLIRNLEVNKSVRFSHPETPIKPVPRKFLLKIVNFDHAVIAP